MIPPHNKYTLTPWINYCHLERIDTDEMWWKFRYLVSLLVTISLKARSETLFVVSGNYYPDQQESSVEAWDISPVIVRKLKQNVRGEVQLAAAMQLPVENETLWDSGMGSLELRVRENEVESLACAYMSVSGADGKYHVSCLSCIYVFDISRDRTIQIQLI